MKTSYILENVRNRHLLNLLEESTTGDIQESKQLITEAINFLNRKLILENKIYHVRELLTESFRDQVNNIRSKSTNGAQFGTLAGLGLGAVAANQYLNSDSVTPDLDERVATNLADNENTFNTDPSLLSLKDNSPIMYNYAHDVVVNPDTAESMEVARNYGTGMGQGAILGGSAGLAAGLGLGLAGAGRASYQKSKQVLRDKIRSMSRR